MKPVVRRDQASRDASQAAFWYFEQAGLAVAERFTDALKLALRIWRNTRVRDRY